MYLTVIIDNNVNCNSFLAFWLFSFFLISWSVILYITKETNRNKAEEEETMCSMYWNMWCILHGDELVNSCIKYLTHDICMYT